MSLTKIANCKFLYGSDVDIVTFPHGGDYVQAAVMKLDPSTATWTKLLHGASGARESSTAIRELLKETETKIADLFTTNGWSLPLSGEGGETITLHAVRSPSTANNCGESQNSSLEFINTPNSKSQSGVVFDKDHVNDELPSVLANAEIESAINEQPQDGRVGGFRSIQD